MTKHPILANFEDQLLDAFQALQQGKDFAPASRYRMEGFAQALVAMQVVSEADMAATIVDCYQQVFQVNPPTAGEPLSIPCVMQRAPVYPSTHDD